MVILLLGGSASGKSQWAEGLAAAVPSSTLQLWRRRTGNPAAG